MIRVVRAICPYYVTRLILGEAAVVISDETSRRLHSRLELPEKRRSILNPRRSDVSARLATTPSVTAEPSKYQPISTSRHFVRVSQLVPQVCLLASGGVCTTITRPTALPLGDLRCRGRQRLKGLTLFEIRSARMPEMLKTCWRRPRRHCSQLGAGVGLPWQRDATNRCVGPEAVKIPRYASADLLTIPVKKLPERESFSVGSMQLTIAGPTGTNSSSCGRTGITSSGRRQMKELHAEIRRLMHSVMMRASN